ncbi:MAG: RDD family protein, partial [bacterium]|nr:RDD family protein [bacterium]
EMSALDDDLTALFDEAEAPAQAEAVAEDDLTTLLDAAAEEPEAAEAPTQEEPAAAESPSGDDAALDDLWGEAMAEQSAGEAAQVAGSDAPAPAEASADDSGEESIDDLWGEAFAEQEASQAQETSGEPAGAAAVSTESGKDDLSGMWDEAFAEQEAAQTAIREGVVADADVQDAEIPDDDLDQLLAGEEAGVAAPAAEGEAPAAEGSGEASAEEPAGADEGILSQGDLDDLLSSFSPPAEKTGKGEATVADADPAGNVSPDLEDLLGESAPAPATADVDDEEEIEAFIPEDGPAPVDDEVEAEAFAEPVAAMAGVDAEDDAAPAAIGMMSRLLAALVDVGVVGVLELIFAGGTHFIVAQVAGSVFSNMEALVLVLALDLMVLFLLSLLYSVYFVGLRGETVGQALIGLRVVDLDDRPVGYMQAVLRYFGGLAATVPLGLGHVLVFLDKKGRSLGDRLAGTKVVASAAA